MKGKFYNMDFIKIKKYENYRYNKQPQTGKINAKHKLAKFNSKTEKKLKTQQ